MYPSKWPQFGVKDAIACLDECYACCVTARLQLLELSASSQDLDSPILLSVDANASWVQASDTMHKLVQRASIIALLAVPVVGWKHLTATDRGAVEAPKVSAPDLDTRTSHSVIRVVDGDTVVVDIDGVATKVRLVGVDTPETVDPRRPIEAYGTEASEFVKNLLAGERVYLFSDSRSQYLDRYGRRLAYLYRAPDGMFVNLEIVRQGYGHAYVKYPFDYMETFREFEERARIARKGLWRVGEVGANDERNRSTTVYVSRTGSKYHLAGCGALKNSRISMTQGEAREGFEPCGLCSPPRQQ